MVLQCLSLLLIFSTVTLLQQRLGTSVIDWATQASEEREDVHWGTQRWAQKDICSFTANMQSEEMLILRMKAGESEPSWPWTRDRSLPSSILLSPSLCSLIQKGSKVRTHPSYTKWFSHMVYIPVSCRCWRWSKRSFGSIWTTGSCHQNLCCQLMCFKHLLSSCSKRADADEKIRPKCSPAFNFQNRLWVFHQVLYILNNWCWFHLQGTNPAMLSK